MAVSDFRLNSNEIFAALFNMIISQEVFADNISGTNSTLVDMNRVDGGLYGDQKTYYSTDVLKSFEWGNDAEANNLLKLYRPASPKYQAIQLDVFRQIPLTVDDYLSKRAWGTEGAFGSFNSIMLGWIRDTKRIYDATTFNTYVGTAKSEIGKQSLEITLPTSTDAEAQSRLQAEAIGEAMANLMVDLKDVTRDFNDNGFLRSYDPNRLAVVWNAKAVNKIEKRDLPMIFHKDGIIDKFAEFTLPARYFGKINASGGTTSGSNTTIRALHEIDFNVVDMSNPAYDPKKHCFAGDLLPNSQKYGENETYTEDGTVLFKIMDKHSVPFMSAFEVGTSFFNPKSLTENHYLTWGHNTLQYLKNYPMITVTGVEGA